MQALIHALQRQRTGQDGVVDGLTHRIIGIVDRVVGGLHLLLQAGKMIIRLFLPIGPQAAQQGGGEHDKEQQGTGDQGHGLRSIP